MTIGPPPSWSWKRQPTHAALGPTPAFVQAWYFSGRWAAVGLGMYRAKSCVQSFIRWLLELVLPAGLAGAAASWLLFLVLALLVYPLRDGSKSGHLRVNIRISKLGSSVRAGRAEDLRRVPRTGAMSRQNQKIK